jgi:hypothetical protein
MKSAQELEHAWGFWCWWRLYIYFPGEDRREYWAYTFRGSVSGRQSPSATNMTSDDAMFVSDGLKSTGTSKCAPPRPTGESRSRSANRGALRALSSPWHLGEQVAVWYWAPCTGQSSSNWHSTHGGLATAAWRSHVAHGVSPLRPFGASPKTSLTAAVILAMVCLLEIDRWGCCCAQCYIMSACSNRFALTATPASHLIRAHQCGTN